MNGADAWVIQSRLTAGVPERKNFQISQMETLQPGMGRDNHEPGRPAAAWFVGSTDWLADEILWPAKPIYQ
jgi:hypothetical protein